MEDIGTIIEREKQQLRNRLIEIYDNGDEDIKAIICLLIQEEYTNAIKTDNYNRAKNIPAHNLEKYEKENRELIDHCWLSRVGR